MEGKLRVLKGKRGGRELGLWQTQEVYDEKENYKVRLGGIERVQEGWTILRSEIFKAHKQTLLVCCKMSQWGR